MRLAEQIGQCCRGGEVFALESDLGGGKTTFVRGLARGLGLDDEVSSPSFTINNTYQDGRLTLEHFDFYRLEDPGLLTYQLEEDVFSEDSVVAVEWGGIVADVLPPETIHVALQTQSDDTRTIVIAYQPSQAYLIKDLDT